MVVSSISGEGGPLSVVRGLRSETGGYWLFISENGHDRQSSTFLLCYMSNIGATCTWFNGESAANNLQSIVGISSVDAETLGVL